MTTADVARICLVDRRTVLKWCKLGLLQSFQLPLSGQRRIHNRSLLIFMRKHKMGALVPEELKKRASKRKRSH